MAEYIKGSATILDIWNDTASAYEPIVCLTSHSFSESTESVETVNKCTEGAIYREAGTYSYEISFEGQYAKTEVGKLSWVELKEQLRSLGNFTWRSTTTYKDLSTEVEYGDGFFSSLEKSVDDTGSEFISFSGSLMGSLKPTSTDPKI